MSTKLLKDNADLKAQIVRSPDRQRKEISEMSSQRIELQNTVQAYRNKTRDLTGRIDTMGELEFVRSLPIESAAKLSEMFRDQGSAIAHQTTEQHRARSQEASSSA